MKAALVYTKEYELVDYGPDHPFRRERFIHTYRLFRQLFTDVEIIKPELIPEEMLLKVHFKKYVNIVKKYSKLGSGYLSMDTPVFRGIFEWALWYCSGSIKAAELVRSGYFVAFNPCGGLHHAKQDSDGGFCVFNDVALVAKYHTENGFKVAIVDYDAHAGDGTMHILYDEPILKISIHEDPNYLYPGDGFVDQAGKGKGFGYSLNIPMPLYSGDDLLEEAFRDIIIPALKKYSPDVIIVQSGVDGYKRDPLTHLRYSAHGYHSIAKMLRSLEKPIVMLGGGGYYLPLVPKLWALIFATLIGKDRLAESLVKDIDAHPTKSSESTKAAFKVIKKAILEGHPFFVT